MYIYINYIKVIVSFYWAMFRKYVEKPKCVFEIRLRFFNTRPSGLVFFIHS